MNDLNKMNCVSQGTGPNKSVCLLLICNGLGDAIHQMPALSQMLLDGYDLTVYCRAFHVPIYKALGVQTVIAEELESNLGYSWAMENAHKYACWYSLHSWGGWEVDSLGASYRSQFEQFAEIVGTTLPDAFSWLDILQPANDPKDYILYAPESAEVWRTLPKEKQLEVYEALGENVVWLTSGVSKERTTSYDLFPEHREKMTLCKSWQELSGLINNAAQIVSVENGISNVAAAYNKPVTVLCGPTEPTHILGQYRKYIPDYTYEVVQGVQPDNGICQLPCWRHTTRGMINGKCCGTSEKPLCLANISIEEITHSVYTH